MNSTEQCAHDKLIRLQDYLQSLERIAVAFSGGVDSTFLLKAAQDVLGDCVIAITATPYSFPGRELEEAKAFCKEMGIRHFVCEINELEIDGFSENQPDRCYLCKKDLFEKMQKIALEKGISHVAEGSNMDDTGDYRPGLLAVSELGIKSPLREVGLDKEEIATRFAYGERITREKLAMVERAEQLLFDKGVRQVRVRIHGRMARIEVLPEELEKLTGQDIREEIVSKFKSDGFTYVCIDLEGYRTGSMNETLQEKNGYQ